MADRAQLSQRAYAVHRGVTHTAVAKAIKSGRLKKCLVEKGARRLIDVELADAEWAANTDPTQSATVARGKKKSAKKRAARKATKLEPEVPAPEPVEKPQLEPEAEVEDYFLAKARRESALADLAEFDRDEKERRLVLADEQRRDGFRCGRLVRDAFLIIPDRVSSQLAAETDTHAVHALLKEEIVDALRALVDIERLELGKEGAA